jgi:hypothetical protein
LITRAENSQLLQAGVLRSLLRLAHEVLCKVGIAPALLFAGNVPISEAHLTYKQYATSRKTQY